MALTTQQLSIVKADILATPELAVQPMNADGHDAIAKYYNTIASPAFIAWKTGVPIGDIGKSFNNTELAGLTTVNHTRLQTLAIYLAGGVNASIASNRAFFDDIFSGAGGVLTRAALLALWKRNAKRIEKLLASGAGSDAVPATLTFEGNVSFQDIEAARQS